MRISRSTLGVAAEFMVAGELGRRNIYAQPTFGFQKRTVLLILGEKNKLLKVEVKSKQGQDWPNCKGIYGDNVMLVFVDFARKSELERPDFYILTVQDWVRLAKTAIAKYPREKVTLDERNVPIFHDHVMADGQPYRGTGVRADQIAEHKERWDKIIGAVGQLGDDRE
jgi:hypothetical protein